MIYPVQENRKNLASQGAGAGPARSEAGWRLTAAAFVLAIAGTSGTAFAQGTLTTSDGLRLSLSSSGAVTDLSLNDTDHASSTIADSGFLFREMPSSPSNLVPNGSFESGATSPTSWSWTNDSFSSWTLDLTGAALGLRSLKLSIPGSTRRHSPSPSSTSFSILPNASYTVSFQYKTLNLSNVLTVYVLEQGSDGKWMQRGVNTKTGTNDWLTKTMTFTTSPIATRAYIMAEVYSGYGTAWLDDVKLLDVFGGRAPVSFGGSVASDAGGMTQTASASGLDLSARFTSVGTAIKVEATLTDTTGDDRPVELTFRLPLDVAGWNWEQNFVTSTPIADGIRYENLDTSFGAQTHSNYPFATVRNLSASFSLATPMIPQMNRFSYDTSTGFRVTWDLGLSAAATKTRSQATVTFWIYTSAAKWGLRSAAEKYYALNPSTFTSPATIRGAWALPGSQRPLSSVPNAADFGWGFVEGLEEIEYANANNIPAYHYVDPSGWFRNFPGYTSQPSYATVIAALLADAAAGTGTTVDGTRVQEMAQAVINSSPYDESLLYQVNDKPYFWYGNRIQIYPVAPDADIPAPSMWSVIKKSSVDGMQARQQSYGNRMDGVFLDDMTYTFGNVENHRRSLWAYSDYPLTFSYATSKVILYDGYSIGEFCESLRSHVHSRGMTLAGSVNPGMYAWFTPQLDIVGGEVPGADSSDKTYIRRTLGYGRPWSNLLVNNTDSAPPDAARVLAYLRQALAFGYYPGFAGEFWNNPSAYERDRALVKKYIGLINKTTDAGWRPVNYATASDPAVNLERFDNQASNVFYVTAQNAGTATSSVQLTLDGSALDIATGEVTVKELVGGNAVPAARSGANVLFSDTLAPGETALYEVTSPAQARCDPTYGDLNQDGIANVTDLVILSNYLVGNLVPGPAPFSAPLDRADLDLSGQVNAVDLVVLQNFLAGNVACLPKA